MDFYHLYPPDFQDLLKKDYESDSYIGQGNPASKILIIGKECTIADDNNAKIWKTISPENIKNWFEARSWDYYHPRRPFYGQLLLKDNNSMKKPKSWEELNRGTSVTWKAYQLFINMLLPKDLQVGPRQQLNFYITELSSNYLRTSRKNPDTEKSINQRLSPNGILTHSFFKQFPIVILGVYRYIDWYKAIPIIKNFDGGLMNYAYKGIIVSEEDYSQFDEDAKERLPLYKANNLFKNGEFINVHESVDGKHLLLHTNHFVDNFQPRSEVWMKELADLVRPYMSK